MASLASECLATLKEAKEAEGYRALDVFEAEALGLIDDAGGYSLRQLIMVLENQGRSTYVKIDSDGDETFVTPGTAAFSFE